MSELIIRLDERVTDRPEDVADAFDYYLQRGRQWWRTRPDRAILANRLVVVDADNEVVAIGQIKGVEKGFGNVEGRISVTINELRDSTWLGKRVQRNKSRNPVAYEDQLIELD